jgi:chitinase
MLLPRKIVFFLFLFVGLSLYAQQNYLISSYVRGNFYNRGRISAESLRASDDLIFLNVRPNKDGSLSFENPRIFENGKGVTSWEELIKSVRADVKGTKTKLRLGAASGEWKAMVADEAARAAFAKNIKKILEKNKLDGIDLDFEWAETEKEYEDYSQAILKMREERCWEINICSACLCILCAIRLVRRRLLRSISFLINVTVLRRFASRWRNTVRIYRWR